MDSKNGSPTVSIEVLPEWTKRCSERLRLYLRSPWFIVPICTFVFARQPDSQAGEFVWNAGDATWSTNLTAWFVDGNISTAWPGDGANNDARFTGEGRSITLGEEIHVNDITVDAASGNATYTVSGSPSLVLEGVSIPTVNIATGRTFAIDSLVQADAGLIKEGAGTLRLSANASRLSDITVNAGVLQIGLATSTGGNFALRRSDLFLGAGATVSSVGNTAKAENFNLWTGGFSGSGTVTTKSSTTSTTGSLTLTLLHDTTFSGAITAKGLFLQGAAVQTLTGNITGVTDGVTIDTGSTLRLAGSGTPSLGALGKSSITLRGGSLVLDNTDGDTSAVTGRIDGKLNSFGGTLTLLGDSNGTLEGIDALELYSGATTLVSRAKNGASGVTSIAFTELVTYASSRATLNFDLSATGATITVGNKTPPPLGAWATFGGEEYAMYSATAVVKHTYQAGAGSTTNALGISPGAENYAALDQSIPVVLRDTFDYNAKALRILPGGAGESLSLGRSVNLQVSGILLAGSYDYTINNLPGSAGSLTTPVTSTDVNSPRYIGVSQPNAQLTLAIPIKKPGLDVVKYGAGVLALTADNTATLNSGNTAFVVNEGILRVTMGTSLPDNGHTSVHLRGGVLELANGTDAALGDFKFALGTAGGTVNWTGTTIGTTGIIDRGEGGFSAHGGNATVNIGGLATPSTLTWNSGQFVSDGFALAFGSSKANSRITLLNNVALDSGSSTAAYNLRTFRVQDNPNSSTDLARIAGGISGSGNSDFLKTGPGTLQLTGTNSFAGQTIIHSGALQIGASDGAGAGNGKLSATEQIVVHGGGSLLLGGQSNFQDRIHDTAPIALDGGSIHPNGLSEYTTGAGNKILPGVGVLTLLSSSFIDFGNGASTFAFSDSSHATWNGTLSIYNWGQGDRLFFGSDANGLREDQLAKIQFFSGFNTGRLPSPSISSDGELVVVPEPSTALTAGALLLYLGAGHRRSTRRRASR